MAAKGRVIVRGEGITAPPLLDVTDKASVVEIRDTEGNILMFIVSVFPSNPNTLFGICFKGDSDFDAMCERYGVAYKV